MIARFLLFAAFCTLFLSNMSGLSTAFQILGAALVSLSAVLATLAGKVRKESLTPGEWMMLALVLFSAISGVATLDPDVLVYTLVFGVVFLSIGLLRRALSIDEITDICLKAFIVMLLGIFVTDPAGYIAGVTGQSVYGKGLARFNPYDLHPNLTGFIFGAGTVLFYQRSLGREMRGKIIYTVLAALSFSVVLAASARAGMLAAVGAYILFKLLGVRLRFKARSPLRLTIKMLGLLAGLLLLFLALPTIGEYAVRILDLNNPRRGIESGGTGRVALWELSLEAIGNRNFAELFFGTGIRSSSAHKIGFSLESSYFTLILENGLMLAGLWIAANVGALIRFSVTHDPAHPWKATAALLFGFALVQSIFNRYLLAIGNPASLLLLFYVAETFFRPAKVERKLSPISRARMQSSQRSIEGI